MEQGRRTQTETKRQRKRIRDGQMHEQTQTDTHTDRHAHKVPFVTSMTSSTMSMICAPPMMVRMSEACPGQSTSVYCSCAYPAPEHIRRTSPCQTRTFKVCRHVDLEGRETCHSEIRAWKRCMQIPRSRVMPRSLLCGFLSNAAVEATVLSALAARGEGQ
jgi:hypothetical protein